MRKETVTVECTCDKCGKPMKRECGMIIEDLSAQISGYDPRGSGGYKIEKKEYCYDCSKVLHEALGLGWKARR